MQQPTIIFAVIASIATLAILAFVLRPLWPRRGSAFALVAVLALLTLGTYRLVGTPAALDPAVLTAPDTLQDAIAQLEQRLQQDPDAVEGWRLLGQAYAADKQAQKSRDAYARAAQLAPDDPDVLVEAAESRAIADPGRNFDDKAVAMLQHALQQHPEHQRSRWFLGIAQRQAGDAAKAAETWQPLLAIVDAKTQTALRTQIDAARSEAGLPPLPAAPPAASLPTLLEVAVQLSPELADRIAGHPDAQVFVIARAPDGPPMPAAVEKHPATQLPLIVSLDDGDSPMPTHALSSLKQVEVIARISMRGDAVPQPGDLSSKPVRVELPPKGPVELTIDTVD